MGASYDDNTAFAEDEKGVPICYDWLRVEEAPPVRVQVKQAYKGVALVVERGDRRDAALQRREETTHRCGA